MKEKTLVKWIALCVLCVFGIGIFVLLAGEGTGSAMSDIMQKIGLLIGFIALLLIGKVLARHGYLPDMDED